MYSTPDTPAPLDDLPPFDPEHEPTLAEFPAEVRLDAAVARLLALADSEAYWLAQAARARTAERSRQAAERLEDLARLRTRALDLVCAEARREVAR